MKRMIVAGIFSSLISYGQPPISVLSWASGQIESVAIPQKMADIGNPALVLPFSIQAHVQPTLPGFRSMTAQATGSGSTLGWSIELGTRGNTLLAHQRMRLGISAQKDRFLIGIRGGLHVWQHQHPDQPTVWLPSFEFGAIYHMSSQWQTGFFAGGDASTRFWCMGIAYQPFPEWRCQLEWNTGFRGGVHYFWRPEWIFHAGVVQRSLRTGITWNFHPWRLGAAIARWPEGWITSTYSLVYQP